MIQFFARHSQMNQVNADRGLLQPFSRLRRGLVVLAALCCASGAVCTQANAQSGQAAASSVNQVEVTASFDRDKAFVGEPFGLQIVVSGSRDFRPPDLSALGASFNAEIAFRGQSDASSSSVVIINGRVSSQSQVRYTLNYSINAKKPGTLLLPAIEITVNGSARRTPALSIPITEVPISLDVKLEAVAEATKAYVGQPIRLKLTWTIGRDIKGYALTLPELSDAESLPGPDPRPAGTHPADQRYTQVRIGNDETIALVETRQVGDRSIPVLTLERVVIPRKAGKLTIPGIRADFNVVIGQRQRQWMESAFADLSVTDRQTASSPSLVIDVQDLPSVGRPARFSGLVGSYSMIASASPTDVAVGDPIELTIEVRGPYPLSLVPALDLGDQGPLARAFRVPRDPLLGEASAVASRFKGAIRARDEASTTIPPIELHYFDPTTGTYRVASTAPVALTVRPSTAVSLDKVQPGNDGGVGQTSPADVAKSTTPLPLQPDQSSSELIAPLIAPTPDSSGNGPAILRQPVEVFLRKPWVVGLLAAPIALGLLGLAWKLLRTLYSRSPARQRRARAWRAWDNATRRVGSLDTDRDQTGAGIVAFIAGWFGHDPHSMTSREALGLLREAGVTQGNELEALLENDARRFGGTGTAPTTSRLHARNAARQLEARLVNARTPTPSTREVGSLGKSSSLSSKLSALVLGLLLAVTSVRAGEPNQMSSPGIDAAPKADIESTAAKAFARGLAQLSKQPRMARLEFLAAASGFEMRAKEPGLSERSRAAAWFNSGTARLRAGDLPNSVVALRYSHAIDPTTQGVAANLSEARRRVDLAENSKAIKSAGDDTSATSSSLQPKGPEAPTANASASDDFAFARVMDRVMGQTRTLALAGAFGVPSGAWVVLLGLGGSVVLAGVLVTLTRGRLVAPLTRRAIRIAVALGLALVMIAALASGVVLQHRRGASTGGVVVVEQAQLASRPQFGAPSAATLRAGVEVRILASTTDRSGQRWLEVTPDRMGIAEDRGRTQGHASPAAPAPVQGWVLAEAITTVKLNPDLSIAEDTLNTSTSSFPTSR